MCVYAYVHVCMLGQELEQLQTQVDECAPAAHQNERRQNAGDTRDRRAGVVT
jgi:hypothetical protein